MARTRGATPAHHVRPQQRAEAPHADEDRLVGGDLEALGGLEDDRAERGGRQQPRRPDDRGAVVVRASPVGEHLRSDDEPEPHDHHEEEPEERRHLVEVRGDEPDQAQSDEAGSERQDDAREREPAAGDVAGPDGLGRRGVDQRPRPASPAARPPASAAGPGWRRAPTGRAGRERPVWRWAARSSRAPRCRGSPGGCGPIVLPAPGRHHEPPYSPRARVDAPDRRHAGMDAFRAAGTYTSSWCRMGSRGGLVREAYRT